MIRARRTSCVLMGLLAFGCAQRAPQPEAPRAPAAVSAREWERNGPCAVIGPRVHLFPLTRAQGMGIYGAKDPNLGTTFYTSTPEGCEAQNYRAGKRLAGYVDEMSLANECTTYGGSVVSKSERKNLVKLFAIKDTQSGFKFQSLNKKGCEAQGFDVEPDPIGYANP